MPPAMLILGSVIHQEQYTCSREALDQAVQERLGLRIDPMEILKNQEEWLHLALTQQQTFEGVERALAALGRIELQQRTPVWQDIQEQQECRYRPVQSLVECQHLA